MKTGCKIIQKENQCCPDFKCGNFSFCYKVQGRDQKVWYFYSLKPMTCMTWCAILPRIELNWLLRTVCIVNFYCISSSKSYCSPTYINYFKEISYRHEVSWYYTIECASIVLFEVKNSKKSRPKYGEQLKRVRKLRYWNELKEIFFTHSWPEILQACRWNKWKNFMCIYWMWILRIWIYWIGYFTWISGFH